MSPIRAATAGQPSIRLTLPLRGAAAALHGLRERRHPFILAARAVDERPGAHGFGQRGRHHRQPRGRVLAQLDRVHGVRQRIHAERDDSGAKPAAKLWQPRIRLPPQQVHVRQTGQGGQVGPRFADQDVVERRAPRQRRDQLDVDPLVQHAEEPHPRLRNRRELRRHRASVRDERQPEMLRIDSMRHVVHGAVVLAAMLGQILGRREHHVGGAAQLRLEPVHQARVVIGERGPLVHAAVHEQAAREPGNRGRHVRHERPHDRPLVERQPFELAADRVAIEPAVDLPRHGTLGKRQGRGRAHMQIGEPLLRGPVQGAELGADAPQVLALRQAGRAHPRRLDPEHAVGRCEPAHQLMLARGVRVPVVGETHDRLLANHTRTTSPAACPRTGRGGAPVVIRRRHTWNASTSQSRSV